MYPLKVLPFNADHHADGAITPSHQMPHVSPAQIARAKQAQFADRQKAITETRLDQGIRCVQIHEQMRDSATAAILADVILRADYEERQSVARPDFAELPIHERHALAKDMTVAIRARKPVYRRTAIAKHQQAVTLCLVELFGHKLSAGEIAMAAAAITGRAHTAAMSVLDGSMRVSPTDYAAATLDLLGTAS